MRHEGKIPVLIVLIRAHSCAPVKRRAKYAAGSVFFTLLPHTEQRPSMRASGGTVTPMVYDAALRPIENCLGDSWRIAPKHL